MDEHSWSAFVLPDFCFIPEPHPSVSICGDGAPVTVCVEIKVDNVLYMIITFYYAFVGLCSAVRGQFYEFMKTLWIIT